jgi:hypothetical protein
MDEEKRREKEDDTTREKNKFKRKYIQFYKMSFFEFGSPLLNYLIFNVLCTMLELGASFGKYNDFAYDILSNKQKVL